MKTIAFLAFSAYSALCCAQVTYGALDNDGKKLLMQGSLSRFGSAAATEALSKATGLTTAQVTSSIARLGAVLPGIMAETPEQEEAKKPESPAWSDYVRLSASLQYTRDIGTKQFTLAHIYTRAQRKQTEEQAADQKVARTLRSVMEGLPVTDEQARLALTSMLRGLKKAEERAAGDLVTIRTAQEKPDKEKQLDFIDRFSFLIGTGSTKQTKYFAGFSYLFNPFLGINAGWVFSDEANAKGQFSIGLQVDAGILGKIFGGK